MRKILILFIIIGALFLSFFGLVYLNKSQKRVENEKDLSLTVNVDTKEDVRQTAVAGNFYPDSKEKLEKEVDNFLNQALVVNYSRVILLGSSHTMDFDYLAVDNNKFWETPLGKVEVDEKFVKTLINGRSIREDNTPHLKEHSLEMELIFLQRVLSDFKIVPIITGQLDDGHISLLAQKLAYNFDDETLMVVSSDLSHYPDWEIAKIVDSKVIGSILTGKRENFEITLSNIEKKDYENLETAACAQDAIKIVLEMGKLLEINKFSILDYANSGDVTGEKEKVVGYASIAGYSNEVNLYVPSLDEIAQKEARDIARFAIENYLSSKDLPDIEPQSEYLNQTHGVFVTLTKNNNLRGCIGEFEPTRPLYKVIQDTAVSSATKDARFTPVTYEELEDIEMVISVMTPRKSVDNWQDIRLGTDGVVVKKGIRSGTFLPQVAADNNWDLEEFLSQLCIQKARLTIDCYKDSDVNIYSFEVQSF
jgi:AmmeMemoRadiSam system protein A/AmmeMemoRadiSam system protein B